MGQFLGGFDSLGVSEDKANCHILGFVEWHVEVGEHLRANVKSENDIAEGGFHGEGIEG